MYRKEIAELIRSIEEIENTMQNQLILNPVENIPKSEILLPAISRLHGVYNTDKIRTEQEKAKTKIQFSGREQISIDIQTVYKMWGQLLQAECVSMRLFSGLHAHAVVFMALTNIGDNVILLPEIAGGHMATNAILNRLGLNVYELSVDKNSHCVDKYKSKVLIEKIAPKIIFIDRSEGLTYEDFSWIKAYDSCYRIFDASQYLTNIIAKDYINPFDVGFDAIISTLHKNFPGPQRALFCTKNNDNYWNRYNSQIGTYVSNMHPYAIYSAGFMLKNIDEWKKLSSRMLENTMLLDNHLNNKGLKTIKRDKTVINTHHIWIQCLDKESAYQFYSNLEEVGLLVNYRLLPYNMGYGIRIGLSAATYSGLRPDDVPRLGDFIASVYHSGVSATAKEDIVAFIRKVKENQYFKLES